MKNLNIIILPITILIASIVLGGFYYGAEIDKQKSIERQFQIKLENEIKIIKLKEEGKKRQEIQKQEEEKEKIQKQNVESQNKINQSNIINKCINKAYQDKQNWKKFYDDRWIICVAEEGLACDFWEDYSAVEKTYKERIWNCNHGIENIYKAIW